MSLFNAHAPAHAVFHPVGQNATIYEILTCETYDFENNVPVGITDYFDVIDPGVLFWFNISYLSNAQISVKWFFYPGSVFLKETWFVPSSEPSDPPSWYSASSYMPIYGGYPMRFKGKWQVELHIDDVLLVKHNFEIIDKRAGWGYHAEFSQISHPSSVDLGEKFPVEMVIKYNFRNKTILTPGIWDPQTEDPLGESYDELKGAGTKSYTLYIEAPDAPGIFQMDAAASYLVGNSWLVDEKGFVSLKVTVEEKAVAQRWNLGNFFTGAVVGFFACLVTMQLIKRLKIGSISWKF